MTEKLKEPVDKKNPNYYLDKDTMRDALRGYRDACIKAEELGQEQPEVPNYLGECFLNISRGLGMKHNFRRYSFLNDMIMDGVVTCLKYIRSFDPDKISTITNKPVSPLSYFTQCCFYAFINRINVEEEQAAVKWAMLSNTDIDSFQLDVEDKETFQLNMAEFIQSLGPQKIPKKEEKRQAREKKKQDYSPLDDLEE